MLDFLFSFFADVMSFLYDVWPSYGGAIILFTLAVMLVMAPITLRQTKSMLAMSKLQPEIKRLRTKYGDDRERLNQEMMALYQANGVNPLGGCLPILLQMPVFLVLFGLVRGLSRRVSDIGLAVGDLAARAGVEASEFPARFFNPEYLDEGSKMRQDLEADSEMDWIGLDLSETPSDAVGEGLVHASPYLLMVVAVGLTSWLQQKQIQGRSTNANVNPQQQAIMKILPFMLPVFSFTMPAALVVYFLVSNTFRVFQQMFITRRFYGGHGEEPEIVKPESVAKSRRAADAEQTEKSEQRQRASSSGVNHGSRRPVTNPPKKKPKKAPPKAGASGSKKKPPPQKGSKKPAARGQSKRVTPKKDQDGDAAAGRRRRDKKR
jgi:YidC/Oxa1 family membrane protein insertase